jgi:hypothetical protein
MNGIDRMKGVKFFFPLAPLLVRGKRTRPDVGPISMNGIDRMKGVKLFFPLAPGRRG